METKKEVTISLKLEKLEVLQFSLHEVSPFKLEKENQIEYLNDFEVSIFEISNEIALTSKTKIKIVETKEILSELKLLTTFKITNFNEILQKVDDSSFNIPDALMLNFTSIVLGTIRGILHEKLKGTVIQNEVFPLIDINRMWKQKQNSDTTK